MCLHASHKQVHHMRTIHTHVAQAKERTQRMTEGTGCAGLPHRTMQLNCGIHEATRAACKLWLKAASCQVAIQQCVID